MLGIKMQGNILEFSIVPSLAPQRTVPKGLWKGRGISGA